MIGEKIPLIVFTVILVSITPQVFAQEDVDVLLQETNGVLIEQQKIIFEVGRDPDVRVKHVIETGFWNEERPRIIEIMPGSHSNPSVLDEDGYKLNFSYDAETFEKSNYIILNQKVSSYDLVVEYDLVNFMKLNENIWKKEIKFPFDVMVMVEENIDLIFVNSRPIDVSDASGINCVGCFMTLEIFDDTEIFTELISYNEKKFAIDVLSNKMITQMEFVGGGSDILNFGVENSDQLIVLKIPLELFLNPFDVYFTENKDTQLNQEDKIRKTEFNQNDSHVSVSFRTNNEGIISIVGATQEEHQKKLEQIQQRMEGEKASKPIVEKEKGIAIPIPGTNQMYNEETVNQENNQPKLSFEDELKKTSSNNQVNNSMIVGVISAIIVAIIVAIIIGVIVKIKKN